MVKPLRKFFAFSKQDFCGFHLGQAILRHFQREGLAKSGPVQLTTKMVRNVFLMFFPIDIISAEYIKFKILKN